MVGPPLCASWDDRLMIRPQPLRRIAGITSRVQRKVPLRWTRIMSSNIAVDMISTGLVVSMPALLTRMSTSPSAATMAPNAALTAGSSPTSAATPAVLTPCLANAAAASSALAASRSTTPMLAPSRANRSAIARPMPLQAPVTTAILPPSLAMVAPLSVSGADARALRLGRRQDPLGLALERLEIVRRRLHRGDLGVPEAAHPVARRHLLDGRHVLPRPRADQRAAPGERAARRQVDRARDLALEADRGFAPEVRVRQQDGREEAHRVGVPRPREELGRRTLLDERAQVEHGDATAHVAHGAEVVRDEQVGRAELLLQTDQEVDDLGARGRVEGRGRLVEHDQLGRGDDGPRDPDPLLQAHAELGRVGGQEPLGEADTPGREPHRLLPISPRRPQRDQRLADGLTNDEARVERLGRLLEDELHPAPQRGRADRASAAHGLALEQYRARRLPDQAQDAATDRGLARARFADQRHGLAGLDVEAHPVHGLDELLRARDREVLDEVPDFEQRHGSPLHRKVAADEVAGLQLAQPRRLGAATVPRPHAAGGEWAA